MILKYHIQNWLRTSLQATPRSNTLATLMKRVGTSLIEGESERLAWLGNVAGMKRHSGEVNPSRPVETNFSITNEKFSAGVALPGAWLRNDRTQQVRDKIAQLGARYLQHPGKLAAQLIEGGFTANAYNGTSFFNASHVIGKSGAFSNLLTVDIAGTPATPTADEASKAVATVLAKMLGQPDDQGEPFNEGMSEVAIVCHSDWYDVFSAALSASNLDTGTGVRTNALLFNEVKKTLIASPRLTGLKAANRFVVVRTDGADPFLYQENATEQRLEILAEGSDHYAKNDEAVAEIFAVGNAGYGNPQAACAATLT